MQFCRIVWPQLFSRNSSTEYIPTEYFDLSCIEVLALPYQVDLSLTISSQFSAIFHWSSMTTATGVSVCMSIKFCFNSHSLHCWFLGRSFPLDRLAEYPVPCLILVHSIFWGYIIYLISKTNQYLEINGMNKRMMLHSPSTTMAFLVRLKGTNKYLEIYWKNSVGVGGLCVTVPLTMWPLCGSSG